MKGGVQYRMVFNGTERRRMRAEMVEDLMMQYLDRTGVTSNARPRRYLWTDAFAVCTLLGLARTTGLLRWERLARQLVESVHNCLGKHRSDSDATGWLSGLSEQIGRDHPTVGGLRIGKSQPDRRPEEPYHPDREWDRDGQYFHYLTRWMHALDTMARVTREAHFNLWARELASVAHRAFTYSTPGGPMRMVWKMSVDLQRVVVPSMGHHDSLDGYVTYKRLKVTAEELGIENEPTLVNEIKQCLSMLEGTDWATPDSLGIGGLLVDVYTLEQLSSHNAPGAESLQESILAGALMGLEHYVRSSELSRPAEARLAFRELGLAIGLNALGRMPEEPSSGAKRSLLAKLEPFAALAEYIESFWIDSANRRVGTWVEHQDINDVMLATSLAPGGYLEFCDL